VLNEPKPINLKSELAAVGELWEPRVVGQVNDYDVCIAKVDGEFVWHTHENTDEFVLVLDGELRLTLRDGNGERELILSKGSGFVVPRGVEHRPAATGASILVFEPTGTPTTG
jgi:mannose-6-phosphate isomerase-like protein (cupin superfamily)